MDIITILLVAFGLSMDAFAVSVTSGLAIDKLKIGHALRIGAFFGMFQAIMPIIGWLAGIGLKDFISGIDHWVAFVLLTVIGVKMIFESSKMKEDKNSDPLNVYTLLILSVATSIDALAVGLSLSALAVAIMMPALIIGLTTFTFSFAGVFIGKRVGHLFESKIELAGGLILIGIGIKILTEHLA